MPPDDPAHQVFMGEVIESAIPPISLSCSIEERETHGETRCEEAVLECASQTFRVRGSDETSADESITVPDQRDSFFRRT